MPTPSPTSNTPSSSTPQIRFIAHTRLPARPRIKIQIPPPNAPGSYYGGYPARSPYIATALSNHTQGSKGAPQWPTTPYVNQFSPHDKESMNAGEFIFKQFNGLKDFTVDWTKSGLNHGEKSVFFIYDKISRWSRRWFTHFFLMFIVFLYSVAGAEIFMYVEGSAKYFTILSKTIFYLTISYH